LESAIDNPKVNLAVTVSVASAVTEEICLKTQKTPYFANAVPKYAR
jgi:hypothetical protein